jgi:hypothetical protein
MLDCVVMWDWRKGYEDLKQFDFDWRRRSSLRRVGKPVSWENREVQ